MGATTFSPARGVATTFRRFVLFVDSLSSYGHDGVGGEWVIRIYVLGTNYRYFYYVREDGSVSAYLSNIASSSRAVFLVLCAL